MNIHLSLLQMSQLKQNVAVCPSVSNSLLSEANLANWGRTEAENKDFLYI